jgi:hypothetical protein
MLYLAKLSFHCDSDGKIKAFSDRLRLIIGPLISLSLPSFWRNMFLLIKKSIKNLQGVKTEKQEAQNTGKVRRILRIVAVISTCTTEVT